MRWVWRIGAVAAAGLALRCTEHVVFGYIRAAPTDDHIFDGVTVAVCCLAAAFWLVASAWGES